MVQREVLDHQALAVGNEQLDQRDQGPHGPGIMRRACLAARAESEYGAS